MVLLKNELILQNTGPHTDILTEQYKKVMAL